MEESEVNTEEQESPASDKPAPGIGEQFVRHAPLFSEGDRTLTRLTPGGFFLSERLLSETLTAFQSWWNTQQSKQLEVNSPKILKKLLGTESPAVSYLLDGKTCLVGFLIPGSFHERDKLPYPFFRGSLLDAKDYLHIRDPLFEELPDARSVIDSNGFRLVLTNRKKDATLQTTTVSRFAEIARNSPPFLKRHPGIASATRATLPALCHLWKHAKVFPQKHRLLVPSRWARDRELWYLRSGEFVFVQNRGGEIIDCFGTRGKNLHEFLTSEFESLRASIRGKKFHSFSFETPGREKRGKQHRSRNRGLGNLSTERDGAFVLEAPAFKDFIELAPSSKALRSKLPARYTVRKVLEQLGKIFKETDWAETYHIPHHLHRNDISDARYRVYQEWVFVLRGKRNICSCVSKSRPNKKRAEKRRSSPSS